MYMYKNDGYVRRYSESFKLKVLDELAKGNHSKSSNKPNLNLIKLLHLNPGLIRISKNPEWFTFNCRLNILRS